MWALVLFIPFHSTYLNCLEIYLPLEIYYNEFLQFTKRCRKSSADILAGRDICCCTTLKKVTNSCILYYMHILLSVDRVNAEMITRLTNWVMQKYAHLDTFRNFNVTVMC